MFGGPDSVDARNLQRYKRLLLVKMEEMSATKGADTFVLAEDGRQGDAADQASSDAEADLRIRLHQTDGRLLRAIEQALIRVKQGTYGICVTCKQSISKARLNAVPWTRHCLACKENQQV